MRTLVVETALLLGLIAPVSAQTQSSPSISVSFAIDGKPARCTPFSVDLGLNGEIIKPNHTGQKFDVPSAFNKPSKQWREDQRVDISLTCNQYVFVFPKLHPGFIREGDWELGIARPPYSIERFRRTTALEHGAWLSYVIFEGEPGVVVSVSQPDLPTEYADALRNEQPNASGVRARNIAYALAVFGIEYQRNRDYLLSLLNNCLSRPKESPEDDECDSELLDFVTNLYWRGDDTVLAPLLRVADTRRDVISEIGTFYSDLLDRRGSFAMQSIGTLSAEQQQMICRLAYEDDLSIDSPKRDGVIAFLRRTGGELAARCLGAFDDR